jgi:hypothetical protein
MFTLCSAHDSALVVVPSDSPCEKNQKMVDLSDFERGQIIGVTTTNLDIRQLQTHDMIRQAILHTVAYFRKSLHLENTQGSLQSGMPGSTVKHGGGSVMVWATISWYSIQLVPLLPFMAESLQGSAWTGGVIRCIP